MSALVGSGSGREGTEYIKVKQKDVTLYVPDFLNFRENTLVIQKVQARGKTFLLVKNWERKE